MGKLHSIAHNKGVKYLACTGQLAINILVEESIVVIENGKEGEEAVVASAIPDFYRVQRSELDSVGHRVHINFEAVEIHAVLLDVHQNLLAGQIF